MAHDYEEILDNGLCFIETALAELKSNNHDNKYVTLHLFSGIFLILKIPLYSKHWSLVVADIDKTKYSDFEKGDFHGVNFENCLRRLSETLSITINNHDKELLNSLRKKRNKIEHFKKEIYSEESEKPILYRGLEFAIRFIHDHINLEDSEYVSDRINNIIEEASEVKGFCKEKMSAIKKNLKEQILSTCNQCQMKALLKTGDIFECKFCYYRTDDPLDLDLDENEVRELVKSYIEPSKVVLHCNNCDYKFLILKEGMLWCAFCKNTLDPSATEIEECDDFRFRDVRRTKDLLDVRDIVCSKCDLKNKVVPLQKKEAEEYVCLVCQENFSFTMNCRECYNLVLTNDSEEGEAICSECHSNY